MEKKFRGQKQNGDIFETNNIEAFNIQDFVWIEEIMTMNRDELCSLYKEHEKFIKEAQIKTANEFPDKLKALKEE